MANPLVNELLIGIDDKDRWNTLSPSADPIDEKKGGFLNYYTHSSLPALIQTLFPTTTAPTKIPRTDLVSVFLTGIDGLNKTPGMAEMVRLNTAIAPVPLAAQNQLGVLAGDNAGYPNGRRPADDVVDITLRAAYGALLSTADAPSGQLPLADGVRIAATDTTYFTNAFPYIAIPLPGSPGPVVH